MTKFQEVKMKTFIQFITELRSNETLKSFLEPTHVYVGDERVEMLDNNIQLRKDKFGSFRFMKLDPKTGQSIGVIQVISNKKGIGHVANAYVKPEHRRQGIGSELVKVAKKIFNKKLTFSDDRSEDGQDFVASVDK